ncbi:hypothetical protein AB1L30_05915 [Bremerella sp. JC817]|uniref:hypothetical protein n=1 Tax=Bremerella sp. JC817 TaxID=3231756 RepID=UPI00345AFB77
MRLYGKKLVALITVAILLKSGCVSVRYDDVHFPDQPTMATCAAPEHAMPALGSVTDPQLEPPPVPLLSEVTEGEMAEEVAKPPAKLAELAMAPAGEACEGDCPPESNGISLGWHHRLKALWWMHRAKKEERVPAVAPLIPPHSRFNPVPTHPVFSNQVIYTDEQPRPLPSKMAKPMPQQMPTHDRMTEQPSGDENAPKTLDEDLRVATPITLNAPVRPISSKWKSIELE